MDNIQTERELMKKLKEYNLFHFLIFTDCEKRCVYTSAVEKSQEDEDIAIDKAYINIQAYINRFTRK